MKKKHILEFHGLSKHGQEVWQCQNCDYWHVQHPGGQPDVMVRGNRAIDHSKSERVRPEFPDK